MVKAYRRRGNPIFAQQWTGDIKPFVKDTINTDYFDFWLDTLVENDIKVDADKSLAIKQKGKYKYIIKDTNYVVYKDLTDEEGNKIIDIKIFTEEEFNDEYEIIDGEDNEDLEEDNENEIIEEEGN